jgi:hypothetical protein
MATATEESRRKVIEARAALGPELDGLAASTRAAVDIPAKVRRNPVQTAALAAGAGFLAVGGPRRVLRATVGRVLPRKRGRYDGLLPKDIEHVIKQRAGRDAPEIQDGLEEDFAQFLKRKEGEKPPPTVADSVLRTYDALIGPVASRLSFETARRLFAPLPDEDTQGQDGSPKVTGALPPGARSNRATELLGRLGAGRRPGPKSGGKPGS